MSPPNDSGIKIFNVANRLIKKLGTRPDGRVPSEIDPAKIAEAEKVIEGMCADCPATIENNMNRIVAHWVAMQALPDNEERRVAAGHIFTLAHEIKDMGSMCGFGLAAYFAESLRDYIGRAEVNMDAQRIIIQAHIDALTVVSHQGLRDDAGPVAEELKEKVKIAVQKYS